MMDFIDAAIPLAIGLFLLIRPRAFFKPTGVAEDEAKSAKLRKIGVVLVGVGIAYAVVKMIAGKSAVGP